MTPVGGSWTALLGKPLVWLPIALALASIGLILVVASGCGFGAACAGRPDGDEGAPARLFQLSMVVQAGLIGLFALRWLPKRTRPAAAILTLQVVVSAIPIVLIVALES